MRVSSNTLQLEWLADVYRRQTQIARLQNQVTSGLRIGTAADDPAGAAQVVSLQQGLDRLANYSANAEAARRRLSLEENALSGFTDSVTRIRELAVEAGGGVQTTETRTAIATEMRELLNGLVDIANSQDGEGRYLFAGNKVGAQPVTLSNAMAVYNGDEGVRTQRIGDGRTVQENDPASEVFFNIRNGNGTYYVQEGPGNSGNAFFSGAALTDTAAWVPDTYTITFTGTNAYTVTDSGGATVATGAWNPGDSVSFRGAAVTIQGQPGVGDTFVASPSANTSVFSTVASLIAALQSDSSTPPGRTGFQNALNASLLSLDQIEGHLNNVRANIGARLAAIDDQSANNDDLSLQLKQSQSTVRDVDYPKTLSDLQTQLIGLQAAEKVFAQTRSMSLFDVL